MSVRQLFARRGLLGPLRRSAIRRVLAAAEAARGRPPGVSDPHDRSAADLSVVVPVHDAPDVTERCLQSLIRHRCGAEIVVVDDGSKRPETRAMLDALCGRFGLTLIRHAVAQSHSRACEAGAAAARRGVICLLNSDTVVTPDCWTPILRLFDDPTVAAAGPVSGRVEGPQRIIEAEPLRHVWDDAQIEAFAAGYTAMFRWPRPAALLGLGRFDARTVSGFAFFVRRTCWEAMGGFDPRLADYGNEFELCDRFRAAGRRLVVTRRSYIHHLGKASFAPGGDEERVVTRRAHFNRLAEQIIDARA